MRKDWRQLAETVSVVGKSGDPHQILLDVLGLHPASVEFHQRNAESLEHIFNRAKFDGVAGRILQYIDSERLQEPRANCFANWVIKGHRSGCIGAFLLHEVEPAERTDRR